MRRVILAMVLLLLVPTLGFTRTADDPWDSLKELHAGRKIRVVDSSFRKVMGRFQSASEDVLVLRVNKAEVRIPRRQVMAVSLPPSRLKRALLGLVAGAAVGLGAWMEADEAARGCWEDGFYCEMENGLSGRSALIFAGVGAGVAGVVEALRGGPGKVIYIHNRSIPYYEAPMGATLQPPAPEYPEGLDLFAPPSTALPSDTSVLPGRAGYPEGGNVFAPVSSGDELENTKD